MTGPRCHWCRAEVVYGHVLFQTAVTAYGSRLRPLTARMLGLLAFHRQCREDFGRWLSERYPLAP